MNYRFEVDADNAVRVWHDQQDEPFLLQPHWPDQTPFADAAEATAFAEAVIAHHQNPEVNEFPWVKPA